MTKIVGDEMIKMSEQMANSNRLFEKKLAKLQSDNDIEKLTKQIGKKLDKEDAKQYFEN